jgi:hypothetical protein
MQSVVRPSAAALLLPLAAAAFIAGPAHAQPAPQWRAVIPAQVAAPGVAITRFQVRAQGKLQPGHVLHFAMSGAPRGRAWVQVPGTGRTFSLRETRPGFYEGDYKLLAFDNPDALFRAVGHLQRQHASATARVTPIGAIATAPRDLTAPRIVAVTPTQGQRVDANGVTWVVARMTDQGSGIDPASVRMRLDGRDVTPKAHVAAGQVRFGDGLRPGRHVAEIVVRDRAGNTSRASWSFQVAARDAHGYNHG